MSASNWSVCPKCLKAAKAEKAAAIEKARKSYGKVAAEKYESAMAAAAALPERPEETLREDYGQGITSAGQYWVDYHASCECGFSFGYEHKAGALPGEPTP